MTALGHPLAYAKISVDATEDGGGEYRGLTDQNGFFQLEGLPRADLRIFVTPAETLLRSTRDALARSIWFPLPADQDEYSIEYPAAVLEIDTTGVSAEALARTRIHLCDAEQGKYRTFKASMPAPDRDGFVRVRVTAAILSFRAADSGLVFEPQRLDLRESNYARVEVREESYGEFDLVLHSPLWREMPPLQFQALDVPKGWQDGSFEPVQTHRFFNEDGNGTFPDPIVRSYQLPPGTWSVKFKGEMSIGETGTKLRRETVQRELTFSIEAGDRVAACVNESVADGEVRFERHHDSRHREGL